MEDLLIRFIRTTKKTTGRRWRFEVHADGKQQLDSHRRYKSKSDVRAAALKFVAPLGAFKEVWAKVEEVEALEFIDYGKETD